MVGGFFISFGFVMINVFFLFVFDSGMFVFFGGVCINNSDVVMLCINGGIFIIIVIIV